MKENVKTELQKLILNVMRLDIEKIDNHRNLSTIDEWDSFNNLMLISKIESKFNIKFTVKDITDATSISKILNLVESKLKNK
jgi:acyl carrier protein